MGTQPPNSHNSGVNSHGFAPPSIFPLPLKSPSLRLAVVSALKAGTAVFLLTLFVVGTPVRAAVNTLQTPEDEILAKGFSAYMDGKDKLALSYFEEVVRINPRNTAAQRGLEKVRVRLKKQDEREKAKARVLAKAKVKEGQGLLKSGDDVAAIDSFHAALDAVPGYRPAEREIRDIRRRVEKVLKRKQLNPSQWAFYRGTVAYMDRDWAKAYRIWSERRIIEPSNVPLSNATARAENKFRKMMMAEQEEFFRRGARAFYEQGLYAPAKNSWEKVLELRPDDVEGMEGKARAQEAMLRQEGLGRDNKIHDLLEQGLGQYANQNWRRAREIFVELTQLDPNFTAAQEYIVKIDQHLNATAYTPAVRSTDLFREAKPSAAEPPSVTVPEGFENFAESRQELEGQLRRDPSNIRIQQELDKLLKMQAEESERVYKDGLIAYSQGNRSQAIDKWKQVLVIDPDHKKAAAALKKARAEEERSAEEGR